MIRNISTQCRIGTHDLLLASQMLTRLLFREANKSLHLAGLIVERTKCSELRVGGGGTLTIYVWVGT